MIVQEKFAEETIPDVSVVICSRNRGTSIIHTLESVFANEYPSYEVIVVDQSTNKETDDAVVPFRKDSRFRYIHSDTVGTGISRNIGLLAARGEIVAYTDDDCTVHPQWILSLVEIIETHPEVGVVFSSVIPGIVNEAHGSIPHYIIERDNIYKNLRQYYKNVGMGAGMAVRKDCAERIGGFDDLFGPGSPYFSGEDHDFALRALKSGYWVAHDSDPPVIHYGFRNIEDFRKIIKRDFSAIGVIHGKLFRLGEWNILFYVLYNLIFRAFWQPLTEILKGCKPRGFRRAIYYINGIYLSLFPEIDDTTYRFKSTTKN